MFKMSNSQDTSVNRSVTPSYLQKEIEEIVNSMIGYPTNETFSGCLTGKTIEEKIVDAFLKSKSKEDLWINNEDNNGEDTQLNGLVERKPEERNEDKNKKEEDEEEDDDEEEEENSQIREDKEEDENKTIREDEVFKNIKSRAFRIYFHNIISKIENTEDRRENWKKVKQVLKIFRFFFITNTKKETNLKNLDKTIREIIEDIYKLEKEKETKLNEIKNKRTNHTINDLSPSSIEKIFQKKSQEILSKTYNEIIEEFRQSSAVKYYIRKLARKHSEAYLRQFHQLLKNLKGYLLQKKVDFGFQGKLTKEEKRKLRLES